MNVLCAKNLPISKKLSSSLDSYVEIYHISQSPSSTTAAASVSTAASAVSSITTMQQSSTSSTTSHINNHSLSKHNHSTSNTQHYNHHPLHPPSQSSFRTLSHSDIRNIGLPNSALQSSQCYSESEIISILSELSSKFGEYMCR